jgi:hypothetical protein
MNGRFDPHFARTSAIFWPIAPAAEKLAHLEDWPDAGTLTSLLSGGGSLPVRFEPAAPRPRRGRPTAEERYDARIALDRVVPTRARSWHDLLNALVWATFPRAKLALHLRQHRMISARIGADRRLPGARTREQDAVAMLDEGGVVVLRSPTASREIVFGHAIYEGLVCDGPQVVRAAGFAVPVPEIPGDAAEQVAMADVALASLFERDASAEIGRGDFDTVVIAG